MAGRGGQRASLEAWRRHALCGVVAGAVGLGLRNGVEGEAEPPPVVVRAPGDPLGPPPALELHFDADRPAETWAVVRPHLLVTGR